MNKIFGRVSAANGLPSTTEAKLTLSRGDKQLDVTLPWIIKDLTTFKQEQAAATPKTAPAATDADQSLEFGFFNLNKKFELIPEIFQKLTRFQPGFDWTKTFQFVEDPHSIVLEEVRKLLSENPELEAPAQGMALLEKERVVPPKAIPIDKAVTYPAYVTREKIVGPDGKDTGKSKLVGYIYLNTFSPSGEEKTVLDEFKATLATMQTMGVKDLIIDMINNGGGSLTLGMQLAQMLSPKQIVMPDIQFKLSDSWLDEFQNGSINGNDDTREYNRRTFGILKDDLDAGKLLSRKFSTDQTISNYPYAPNADLEGNMNIVLMVNEMCASMCDIFTGILKDNKMAVVVGTNTMGAGGNVVNHYMAPNSHIQVRQTESLMVRNDGSYIENNGVAADLELPVSETTQMKYEPIRMAAALILTIDPTASAESQKTIKMKVKSMIAPVKK